MSLHTLDKLTALRAQIANHSPALDAYIIPSSDEYLNEYIPAHLNRREWLSGFTGSAGDMLVTKTEAWLFADGRYHVQAPQEVDTECINISHVGKTGHLTLEKTLKQMARKKKVAMVGYPAHCMSATAVKRLSQTLRGQGVTLVPTNKHLVDGCWKNRPTAVINPLITIDTATAGVSVADKLKSLRNKMTEAGCTVLPINMLDQVAWLFNLRGSDIPYNPVFLSYAIIALHSATLFLADERFPITAEELNLNEITLKPLSKYSEALAHVLNEYSDISDTCLWVDEGSMTAHTVQQLEGSGLQLQREKRSPITSLKAVKNMAELRGMRLAHEHAAAAWIKTMYWLHQHEASKTPVSEKSFADQLFLNYQQSDAFVSLSFNTIAGAGEHGAIIHYGTPDPERYLADGDLFLVDSGAQYHCPSIGSDSNSTQHDSNPNQRHEGAWMGTTDTTRTFVWGTPTDKQRYYYTHVLQAHIAGTMQKFPKGTTGAQLDGIVRSAMWNAGLDFMHGTGHGVGAFLNVHEGPNGISKGYNVALEPGMIVSMEPGFYTPGWGGIRLENLVEVVELEQTVSTSGEAMLGLKPLTLLPFDPRLTDPRQLPMTCQHWLSLYYQTIRETLQPYLTDDESAFLLSQCVLS